MFKLRVYIDTSVIGGCLDEEFQKDSIQLFDEFIKGIIAPISENSKMSLKKTGRYWKYSLPDYSEGEMALIRLVIYNWLFEGGIIATGSFKGEECLRITPLGQSMFG